MTRAWRQPLDEGTSARLLVTGQVLANVATPEQDRASDGAPVTRSRATGREAGTIHSVDRAGCVELGGVPHHRHQPTNWDTLALRAHHHQQQREAAALCP